MKVLAWCGLLYGILSLRALPGNDSHRLCGPWGCVAPIQAVAAVHGAWTFVMVTGLAWLFRARSPRALRDTGIVLACLGAVGFTVLVGYKLSRWPIRASDGMGFHVNRRLPFAIAMLADLPLVQITIAGTATWYVGVKRSLRCAVSGPEGPIDGATNLAPAEGARPSANSRPPEVPMSVGRWFFDLRKWLGLSRPSRESSWPPSPRRGIASPERDGGLLHPSAEQKM
ncbi:MAG: hypothetical protein P4L84_02320 [Isosphaeraceae bacterium]|nr:hypothetical protein [Isosphaeraceae bacterium]